MTPITELRHQISLREETHWKHFLLPIDTCSHSLNTYCSKIFSIKKMIRHKWIGFLYWIKWFEIWKLGLPSVFFIVFHKEPLNILDWQIKIELDDFALLVNRQLYHQSSLGNVQKRLKHEWFITFPSNILNISLLIETIYPLRNIMMQWHSNGGSPQGRKFFEGKAEAFEMT